MILNSQGLPILEGEANKKNKTTQGTLYFHTMSESNVSGRFTTYLDYRSLITEDPSIPILRTKIGMAGVSSQNESSFSQFPSEG
jgi:hypothetical protein